jgi:UDP-N-acetylglucosamine transferase subunit ALG13
MIFVTVGNFIPFPRLTGAIEDLKRRGMIRDKVFMQVANERRASTEDCHVEQFLTPRDCAKPMWSSHMAAMGRSSRRYDSARCPL